MKLPSAYRCGRSAGWARPEGIRRPASRLTRDTTTRESGTNHLMLALRANNSLHATPRAYNRVLRRSCLAMPTLDDLADRIERLVLRHEELERTNTLLRQQLEDVSTERDSLRSRLTAARTRIDTLLERLPQNPVSSSEDSPR